MKESTQAAKEFIEKVAGFHADGNPIELIKEAQKLLAKWASPSPPQKSKEEIIEQYTPNSEYTSYYHINQIEKMMQEYANQFTQPPSDNEKDENNY